MRDHTKPPSRPLVLRRIRLLLFALALLPLSDARATGATASAQGSARPVKAARLKAAEAKKAAETKKAAAAKSRADAREAARAAREAREAQAGRSRGKASWYGPKFHGKETASGEKFDRNGLTAAHRDLPFGTRVRVTNTHNGRAIIVRINDRGPYSRGRLIDLSEGAARKIGMMRAGTARVLVEVLPGS